MKILLSLLTLLLAQTLHAQQTARVLFIQVHGENELTHEQVEAVIDSQKIIYSSIGVRLVSLGILEMQDIAPELNSSALISTRTKQLLTYGRWARRNGLVGPRRMVHFIFPHSIEGYIGGVARGTCTYGTRQGYSLSNATIYNLRLENRMLHSITAAAHEIGHILGASHTPDDSFDIMNTNILPMVSQFGVPSFAPRSGNQIRKCLKRARRA